MTARGALTARTAILCALLPLAACERLSPPQRAYVAELVRLRGEKDRLLRAESGPLTLEQRSRFKGLAYYGLDFSLVFDVGLEPSAAADTVRFLTSLKSVESYFRLGLLRFEHAGGTHALTLFRSLDGASLFLPFTDRTSGEETYGAGRYVDPEPLADGRYRLDFNLAYNPYCAYNSGWVCPLPPPENHLDFRVEAGEREFPYKEN